MKPTFSVIGFIPHEYLDEYTSDECTEERRDELEALAYDAYEAAVEDYHERG